MTHAAFLKCQSDFTLSLRDPAKHNNKARFLHAHAVYISAHKFIFLQQQFASFSNFARSYNGP